MNASETAVLAYWAEHRAQLRQSESQRATMTNYLLVIAAALSGFVTQQKFALTTLPAAILIVAIGLYGAAISAKYHERAAYHLMQARALTEALEQMGALTDDALLVQARSAHYDEYPRLHKIRLHHLWTGLHLGLAGYGIALAVITLVRLVR